jgi:hypothetical protein
VRSTTDYLDQKNQVVLLLVVLQVVHFVLEPIGCRSTSIDRLHLVS